MGIAVGLFLIAIGAILTWGVTDTSEAVNLDAVGVILMIVGLAGLLLTLLFWQSWWGTGMWRRGAYYDAAAPVEPAAPTGRRYVVEEEEAAPPAPPPGGPPTPP
jgi:hypothetical protein